MILSTTLGSDSWYSLALFPERVLLINLQQTYRARISQLVLFTSQNLPQNSPHNFSAPRLWQIWHNEHRLRSREGSNTLSDLHDHILLQLGTIGIFGGCILDGNKGVDRLAGELVLNADDRGLGDSMVFDKGSFDFGGGETVAGDVDDIIDTASDPVVTFVVTASTVSRELQL